MFTSAPDLETERLLLRGHRRDDYASELSLWGDPEVTRFIGGKPSTPEEVWARLLRNIGHWTVMGFGYWLVHEKSSGRFVGEVGLADHHRDVVPPFGDTPETGWVLMPWAHGRGFATELMTTVLSWTEGVLGAPRTVCMIDPDNAASLRVAGKLGYRELARTTYKGEPAVVLERARP